VRPDRAAPAQAPAPRWQRLDSDQRRAQILEAAGQLFSDRPYSSVSVADIAAAAGVARGLLHHYFGTKRELYLESLRHLMETATVPATPPLASVKDPALWEKNVDAWMGLVEANRDMWFAAIGAGETGRDRVLHQILDSARERTASQVLEVLGLDQEAGPELRAVVRAYSRLAEETTREWLEHRRLTRAQARTFLVGSLPLMVDQLLPLMIAAGDARDDGRFTSP